MSTADLLDILSNGNNPRKIMKHVPKIFQAIKVFKLAGMFLLYFHMVLCTETFFTCADRDQEGRPVATDIDSCVGIEEIPLSTPLKLLGKVEEYLMQAIGSMMKSVKVILAKSIKTYEVRLLHSPCSYHSLTARVVVLLS